MVNFRPFPALVAAASLASLATAHPGEAPPTREELKAEGAIAHAAHLKAARALKACASDPAFVARQERVVARRAETARALREKRGISHSKFLFWFLPACSHPCSYLATFPVVL